jgi:hypothetical protein
MMVLLDGHLHEFVAALEGKIKSSEDNYPIPTGKR